MLDKPAAEYATPKGSQETTPNGHGARPSLSLSDVKQLTDPVESLILKYPAAALASAFTVGVLVAWLIKRK